MRANSRRILLRSREERALACAYGVAPQPTLRAPLFGAFPDPTTTREQADKGITHPDTSDIRTHRVSACFDSPGWLFDVRECRVSVFRASRKSSRPAKRAFVPRQRRLTPRRVKRRMAGKGGKAAGLSTPSTDSLQGLSPHGGRSRLASFRGEKKTAARVRRRSFVFIP